MKVIRLVVPAVADQDHFSDVHGAEQPGRWQAWAECGSAVPGLILATWSQGPGVSAPPGLRARCLCPPTWSWGLRVSAPPGLGARVSLPHLGLGPVCLCPTWARDLGVSASPGLGTCVSLPHLGSGHGFVVHSASHNQRLQRDTPVNHYLFLVINCGGQNPVLSNTSEVQTGRSCQLTSL